MKNFAIIIGLFVALALTAVPAFPSTLQFDFNDDEVWDTEWPMTIGETVEVDVWLDGYTRADIITLIYKFEWDQASIEIMDAWPNDADNGGPWDPLFSYANVESGGEYWYRVGTHPSAGQPVDNKIKLHTIKIKRLTNDISVIKTYSPGFAEILYEGGEEAINSGNHANAEIHAPSACELTIMPETASVYTWDTVQFATTVNGSCPEPEPSCYTWAISVQESTGSTISATGLYTAGGDEGTDTIKVTDTCNGDITDTAEVSVSTSTTTTSVPTTTTSIPSGPTTTTTIIDIGGRCITDKSCNDGIFCNGEEICDRGVYSWSAGAAGSTGGTGTELGTCQRGDEPCPDDGYYCTGEISCDEENEICLSTGDPCEPEGLICDEESDICRPPECVDDEDCDDRLFCNGEETCVDGSCKDGENPCLPDEKCDEENNVCIPEIDIPPIPPFITISPDPLLRSRWIMLPTLVAINGEETTFSQLTSRVSYSPSTALLPMPALVMNPGFIWQMVFVNPSWLAGFPGDPQTVTATVDGLSDDFEIKLLPFILDQKHRSK